MPNNFRQDLTYETQLRSDPTRVACDRSGFRTHEEKEDAGGWAGYSENPTVGPGVRGGATATRMAPTRKKN